RCCDRARRYQVGSKPHREGAPAYRGQGPEQLCGVVLMATLSYLRDCFGRDPSMLRSVTARRGSRKGFSYRRLPFAVKTLLDGDVRHRRGWRGPCQCFWPVGIHTTSGGWITCTASPHRCTRPIPAVTMSLALSWGTQGSWLGEVTL